MGVYPVLPILAYRYNLGEGSEVSVTRMTHEEWAKRTPKSDVGWKEELSRMSDLRVWEDSVAGRRMWNNAGLGKRVPYAMLPNAQVKAIRHIWLWGDEEARSMLELDQTPELPDGEEKVITTVIPENMEEVDLRGYLKSLPEGVREVTKTVLDYEALEGRRVELLADDEVLAVVRQPILLINSRIPTITQRELGKIRAAYKNLERGVYASIGNCPMLGIWDEEVRAAFGLVEEHDRARADWIPEAISLLAADDDHDPVFRWINERNLAPAADARRRRDVWYVPLLPSTLDREGGVIHEWVWPDHGAGRRA